MKKFILSVFMCLMLMSISTFAQDDTPWNSTYTDIIIKPGNPDCKLTIHYNWRINKEGIREVFIYHRILANGYDSDCRDYYFDHINMFNDIAIEQILFEVKPFPIPIELSDCKENKNVVICRVFSNACQSEETILNDKTFEYHFRACTTTGNCSAFYEYCYKYDYLLLKNVVYCKKTIEQETTSDCPETVKDADGIPRQCHPVHCFPFINAFNQPFPVPTKDDVIKFTDKEYYGKVW